MPPAASDKKVLRLNMTLPPWIDLPSILSNPDIPWCRRLLPYYWRRSSFAKRRRWQFMPAQRIAATCYGISVEVDHSGLMLAARITLPHF
jgi:hypothetical protein